MVFITFVGILSSLTLLTVLYLKLCLTCPGKKGVRHKEFSGLKEIQHVLSPPLSTRSSMLTARAAANIRLIHAFDLTTTTFTSGSPEVNQVFRKNVNARMKRINSTNDWKDIGDQILGICRSFLSEQPDYDYDAFIQVVVFTTVMFAFFDVSNRSTLNFSEVAEVTSKINRLWIASKTPTFHKSANSDLSHISRHLQDWIDPDPDNPFCGNPLELIIPAYETMWRLVAHAYVYIEGSPEYKDTFLIFADNPTISQLRVPIGNNSASAENIIQEILRLHPPTRRIKRAIPLSRMRQLFVYLGFRCFSEQRILSANIEGLHTSSVWDPLPHDFDALRHKTLTPAQRGSFLPFGYGPLKCIAMEFAPRFAATILGSLLKMEGLTLIRGESRGEREGWQGWKLKNLDISG